MGERSRGESTSFPSGLGPRELGSSSSIELASLSTSLDILELGVELSEHVQYKKIQEFIEYLADHKLLWYLHRRKEIEMMT